MILLDTVKSETANMADVVDILGLLKREIEKAKYLAWEINTEFFDLLTYAVERKERDTVTMLTEIDSHITAAKAEIVFDLLEKMIVMINDFRKEIEGGANNDSDG